MAQESLNIFPWCFVLMFLFHIIDDFVLQPICLAKLKQKKYWIAECKKQNICYNDYAGDHIAALIIHALSWSIMITLPFLLLNIAINPIVYNTCLVLNTLIHAITDHYKANKLKINLRVDQSIHILQIIFTYIILVISLYFNEL